MAIDSTKLLVWVKAMSRGQALPLDASEVYESYEDAVYYASNSAIAYPGQTIKALTEDGKYHSYMLQPGDAGYTLEEIGVASSSNSKQYVMVVDELPESGQIEGILYINGTDGYIWTGSAWRKVFWDVSSDVETVSNRVDTLEDALDNKAPIENPVFSGTVMVGEDEVALKSYVEGLFANLVSSEPGIVDSENPLPENYKAGQTFRVAEAGVYAGVNCEVGDLIMVVKNYDAETASNDDFMVLQANIDGAVTSAAETSTIGEVVVFDSVTGKVIKGSGIQVTSLTDIIAKAHEHENKDALDSYTLSQTELLASAKSEAEALVADHETAVDAALANKADKGSTLEDYGIENAYNKTEIDSKFQTVTDNLNTKVTGTEVDAKIATAKEETLSEAATAANEALETRIGEIPSSTTVKSYIDTAVGSGGTSSAEAIAAAKQEAIEESATYTDTQIAEALAIVEF